MLRKLISCSLFTSTLHWAFLVEDIEAKLKPQNLVCTNKVVYPFVRKVYEVSTYCTSGNTESLIYSGIFFDQDGIKYERLKDDTTLLIWMSTISTPQTH